MDPFSIIGIVIVAVIVLFLGRILSFLTRVLFVALLVALVLIIVFGVSLDQVIDWATQVLFLAF